ncbi:hypothetical protein NDU88_005406 [Pleurodeles waltl]|uniref:Uncharacterized protein n=1 Tax=Pleurodeles waltl TaxID=8319 RepID=A0AAV7VLP3_PLEWA|nr:hypothetical protein NDU88_005406 [Pleurodeles waltl]
MDSPGGIRFPLQPTNRQTESHPALPYPPPPRLMLRRTADRGGGNKDARSGWFDRAGRRTTPRPTTDRYAAALNTGGPGLTRGRRLNPPLYYGP